MKFSAENFLPVSSLFILLLIISGNFLDVLFPCQLRYILENNILVKHFLAFLTLFFFAVLSDTENNKSLTDVLKSSLILYLWFILIIRMNANFFITLIVIIASIHVLKIYKRKYNIPPNNENSSTNLTNSTNPTNPTNSTELKRINMALNILYILSIIITIIGFSIYYFEKRIEYGNRFNNFTFFFGKISCRNYSPVLSLKTVIKEAKKHLARIKRGE